MFHLLLDSLASFLLVDAAVVVAALAAICSLVGLAITGVLVLFALHGQTRQAGRDIFRSSRVLLALLTLSMVIHIDFGTFLAAPISSTFWILLSWAWRSGLVLLVSWRKILFVTVGTLHLACGTNAKTMWRQVTAACLQ